MSERIEYWVNRFLNFDIYTNYSDDHRVWREGLNARGQLKVDVANALLTDEEKHEIMRLVGEQSDKRYLESRQKYSCVAKQPLWNEGNGPDRKYFVKGYLGL